MCQVETENTVEWFSSEQIAGYEGTTPRGARRKYKDKARSRKDGFVGYVRRIPGNGGDKLQFHVDLLDEATKQKVSTAGTRSAGSADRAFPPAPGGAAESTNAGLSAAPMPGLQQGSVALVASEPFNQFLPLDVPEPGQSSAMPVKKLAWARAKKRVIESLIPNNQGECQWESWKGQIIHGILIRTKDDFVRALAKDLAAAQPVLVPLNQINEQLREATGDPLARIGPVSARNIWRLYGWYTEGRPLLRCKCGGGIDQKSGNCERCGVRQCLPPGLEALQHLDRADKGQIRLRPEFAKYLTAAYLGGDESIKERKQALERPRSAAECRELICLEIASGNLPGPAPSYHQVSRWVREFIPRTMRDYGRLGEKRAFNRRGPYIVRSHANCAVNDIWYWDFRRLNVRTWLTTDGGLYRPFLCAGLDAASRDVVFQVDLYPSAQLFKSTLRAALLKWGVARECWLDNGKEFTCEEVTGSHGFRSWPARFEIDDECRSIFDKLGSVPHYCLVENPTGKALLERFFQTFDRFERNLPGWTGERTGNRPQRLQEEERQHMQFCAGARASTPLLRFDVLDARLTEHIEYRYRHRKHRGDGMYGRTAAQVQAAFQGERRIPRSDELDILLWHRQPLTARGDKVSFVYRGRTLVFRSDHLLALPGDGVVEVHVDPLNADRALAFTGGRVIPLEPVTPTGGQSTSEIKKEIRGKRKREKAIREATLAGSRLAPIPSPERFLSMAKAQAEARNNALESERRDRRTEFSIPVYAEAAGMLQRVRPHPMSFEPVNEEPVFTSRVEAEEWQKRKQKGL
jgi:hypothetical protein